MFPAVHTMWLMLVVVGLNVLGTIVILIQVPEVCASVQMCPVWLDLSGGRTRV